MKQNIFDFEYFSYSVNGIRNLDCRPSVMVNSLYFDLRKNHDCFGR